MASDGEASVTHWIGDLKAGDGVAAQNLWERYFAILVRLARSRLLGLPRTAIDEEDVALSAFHSLCSGAAGGRFPRLDDREDLWRLLVTITARKAADLAQSERRLKRGGGRVSAEAGLDGPRQVASREPTPEFAALVAMIPHLAGTGADVPWSSTAGMLLAVFAAGMLAALGAVRAAARTPVVETLRSE